MAFTRGYSRVVLLAISSLTAFAMICAPCASVAFALPDSGSPNSRASDTHDALEAGDAGQINAKNTNDKQDVLAIKGHVAASAMADDGLSESADGGARRESVEIDEEFALQDIDEYFNAIGAYRSNETRMMHSSSVGPIRVVAEGVTLQDLLRAAFIEDFSAIDSLRFVNRSGDDVTVKWSDICSGKSAPLVAVKSRIYEGDEAIRLEDGSAEERFRIIFDDALDRTHALVDADMLCDVREITVNPDTGSASNVTAAEHSNGASSSADRATASHLISPGNDKSAAVGQQTEQQADPKASRAAPAGSCAVAVGAVAALAVAVFAGVALLRRRNRS